MKAHSKTLVIGCGYIGLPLARCLAEAGHDVSGWVHSAASAAALTGAPFRNMIVGSVASKPIWESVQEKYDLVIHCASSGGGGAEAYRQVFYEGVLRMNDSQPKARRLLVSSTSVYGQAQAEVVTENSATEPAAETSRILIEAEKVALASGAIVVRSAGIYGPGRGVLFDKFRHGDAVIEGDGSRWINQIHQRDLVAALVHLIAADAPGEVYNAVDDTPVTHLDYYSWCSQFLHKPMPPYGPVNVHRKRGLTNKRVSNAKLRATGWASLYPSFREGISADNP